MRLVPLCCVASAVVFLGSARAQGPNPLGLTQAVDSAIENHPLVRSARLGIDQAENRTSEARAERIPKIQISETLTRSNNPVFVFGSLLEQGRFGPQNFELSSLNNPASLTNLRSVVSASVPVFDGMKTAAHVAQANIGNEQAMRQKEAAEQRVRYEIVAGYFGVLVSQAALDVAIGAVRMAEADTKRARDRLDAGLAVESDLLSAQVQLAEFKQQRIRSEGDVATAFAALNISMGAPSNERRPLAVQLRKRTFIVAGPETLVESALRHRSDYQQAESGIELAGKRVTERRSEYFPALNVFTSFGVSGRNLVTGSGDYAVGAAATFNLLDRGRPARLEQALVDKRLAETERDRIRDQIRLEVVRAYNRYRAAEEQVEVAEVALSQASETLRIIQDRYETGLTTVTDLLRAETAVVRSQMNIAAARYDQYVGYASVLLSTGELTDVKAFEP